LLSLNFVVKTDGLSYRLRFIKITFTCVFHLFWYLVRLAHLVSLSLRGWSLEFNFIHFNLWGSMAPFPRLSNRI